MKTCNSKIKAHAFLGAAFMLLIALIFTACPQRAKPKAEEPPPGPQKVTFSVEGTPANGTLKAMAGSTEITSGGKVPYGTTVTFTATPLNTEYSVEKWTITGGTLQAGGTEGSLTATVKITGETTVKVRFEHSYMKVPFGANGKGLADHLNTGSPASDGIYYIEVTGLTAADLEGTNVRPSSLGKILKDKSSKKVSLKLPKAVEGLTDMRYCFNGCENLVSVAVIPESVTNMIGFFYRCTSLTQVSAIPEGVTYMSNCFQGCTSLTKAPAIPESVTSMERCFQGCTSLTDAPAIPEGVTHMNSCFIKCTSLTSVTLKCNYGDGKFRDAFKNCTSLSGGSIKVPHDYLQNYKDNANKMGTNPNNFSE